MKNPNNSINQIFAVKALISLARLDMLSSRTIFMKLCM